MLMETARDEFLAYKRSGSNERRPCSPTTLRTYRQSLRSFTQWMSQSLRGAATTSKFTTEVARAYLDHRTALGLSGHTLNTDSTVLREFARWGSKRRHWHGSDVDDIPQLGKPKTLPRPYHAHERDALMALPLEPADRVLRALLYFAGLRSSEVVALRLQDITPPHDLPTGQVIPGRLYVWGKGAKERPVWIHAGLWRELDAYLATVPPGTKKDRTLLVQDGKAKSRSCPGSPWTGAMVRLHMQAWAKKAGVANPKPHRMRHSFATDLIEAGGDVFTVQKLLGHARTETTAIYAEVSERRKAETIAMLPDFPHAVPTLLTDLPQSPAALTEGAENPAENAENR